MRYISLVLFTLFLFVGIVQLQAQKKVHISGFVKDHSTKETLIGATVIDSISKKGTSTDYNGYFNIIVETPATLKVSYVGYNPVVIYCNSGKDTLVNIYLTSSIDLDEIVIRAKQEKNANVSSLSRDEIFQIPSIGGKPDISKGLQMLPGISSQNEGSSILLVRGGDPGQNLYLFDNVPVIYVNHLGGFFSVFNPDIINNIDAFKAGFPARYGGRLSSIIDITQKEGSSEEFQGNFGIGITDASLALEGPFAFENTTFILTGRKTLIDPFFALASSLSGENNSVLSYGFHDINGKITWNPNERNKFSLNLYQGDDYLNYWGKEKDEKFRKNNTWGNWLISGHWKSAVSSKLFSSNSISFTRYRLKDKSTATFQSEQGNEQFKQEYASSVKDLSLRSEWKYSILPKWNTEFGLHSSIMIYNPNNTFVNNISKKNESITSGLTSLFIDNKITFLKNSNVNLGLRLSDYRTNDYSKLSLEPRADINIGLKNVGTINLSYSEMTQYSHLLFTSGSFFNNEVWIPANHEIKPSLSKQITAGWNNDFFKDMISVEVNLFYKEMTNLATYKEGYTNLMGDQNWSSKVETNGIGKAKGIEFLVKKNFGKFTGFSSYTLSNATRKYPNINDGKEFLFDYDRLHSFSITGSYQWKEHISFNFSWVCQSGLPFTPAVGRQLIPSLEPDDYGIDYYEALIYGERNSERMKAYHRLDVSMNYEKINKKGNKVIWTFSVYNLYNRKNPYYYYYNTNNTDEFYQPEYGNEQKPMKLYQVSFFPIIPSISYKVYFNASNRKARKEQERNQPKQSKQQKLKNWLYHENE